MTMIDNATTEPATFQELKVQSDARIAELERQVKEWSELASSLKGKLTEAERWQNKHGLLWSEYQAYRRQVRAALIEYAADSGTDTDDLNELLESLDLDPVVRSKEYNITLSVQVTVEGDNIDWDDLSFDASAYDVSISASEGDVSVDNVDIDGFEEN